MKLQTIAMLAVAAGCLGSGPLHADEINFLSSEIWRSSSQLSFTDGMLSIGQPGSYAAENIPINTNFSYRITGSYQLDAASRDLMVEFVFAPYGARRISRCHVAPIAGTDTVLVAPVKKGDQKLLVANAENWQKKYSIMFHTKPDYADLPNYSADSFGIENIESKDGCWEITLRKSIPDDFPAQCGVRQSESPDYFCISSKIIHKAEEWNSFDVTFAGCSEKGIESGKFWPGTKMVTPLLIIRNLNSKLPAPGVKFKELTMVSQRIDGADDRKLTIKSVATDKLLDAPVFEPDEKMQLKKIMDRDFWAVMPITPYRPPKDPQEKEIYDSKLSSTLPWPVSALPDWMKRHLDIPAFTDVALVLPYFSDIIKNPDGSYRFDMKKMMVGIKPDPDKPFLVSPQRFLATYRPDKVHRFFYLEKFEHQQAPYQEWLEKHPNFIAANSVSEWGNECNVFDRRIKGRIKNGMLSDQDVAEIRKRFPEREKMLDRQAYIQQRLKPYFERCKEVWHDDPQHLYPIEGMWCINHLAAYWGAGIIAIETSRSYANWQVQMMFNRGAARQFGIPWAWYVASYLNGFDSKGQWQFDTEPAAFRKSDKWQPGCGMSLSARKRVFYMTFLSGANLFMREDTDSNFWDKTRPPSERWEPAEEARVYIDFYNFTRENPGRGTPYTPIALLVPHDRGACREIYKAFGTYPYTRSDHMYDAFITSIFPAEPELKQQKQGIEITLRNSKYGEVFDVLTPDFENQQAFKNILPSYKVAILIGEYKENPEMAEFLQDYVAQGGTLILNVKQLNRFFPENFTGIRYEGVDVPQETYKTGRIDLKGARVFAADDHDIPLFTINNFGKGKVIVGTPAFLTPDFDETNMEERNLTFRETKNGGKKFIFIEYLLDRLVPELLPLSVSGDIQYGLNKTPQGWWLYLFNNKGIIKFTDIPETFDMTKTANVIVNLNNLHAGEIRELITNQTVTPQDKQLHLTMKPGEFAIYDIRTQ